MSAKLVNPNWLTGAIKSVQTGYVSSLGFTSTGESARYDQLVIAAVNSNKSILLVQGEAGVTGLFQSNTSIQLNSPDATAGITARWHVIEFY